jgi:hypothetical protein
MSLRSASKIDRPVDSWTSLNPNVNQPPIVNDGGAPNPLGGFSALRRGSSNGGGLGGVGGSSSNGAKGESHPNKGGEGTSSSNDSSNPRYTAPPPTKRKTYISKKDAEKNPGWTKEEREFAINESGGVRSNETTPVKVNPEAEPTTMPQITTATSQSPAPAPSSPGGGGVGEEKGLSPS